MVGAEAKPRHENLDISQPIVSLAIGGNLVFIIDSYRSEKKMAMRIRFPFAGAFIVLLLLASYIGLISVKILQVNDKLLHFFTFFLMTITFYWILDTTRRRLLNLTFLVVTVGLGLGSEAVQAVIPNGRVFDVYDFVANIVGSVFALGLCTLYHKRMLDRRRTRKGYGVLPPDGGGEDVELVDGGNKIQEDGLDETWDEMGGEDSLEFRSETPPVGATAGV